MVYVPTICELKTGFFSKANTGIVLELSDKGELIGLFCPHYLPDDLKDYGFRCSMGHLLPNDSIWAANTNCIYEDTKLKRIDRSQEHK